MDATESLETLAESLQSALSAIQLSEDVFSPPEDGISLLDVKNEVLLSYLHNLAFLIVFKLRSLKDDGVDLSLFSLVTKKLVELRVYLENGVRPLEGRLKYQINQVIKASDNFEKRASNSTIVNSTKAITNGITSDDSASESDNEPNLSKSAAQAHDHDTVNQPHRPTLAATLAARARSQPTSVHPSSTTTTAYRPPRITPTSMPTTTSTSTSTKPTRKPRSHLLDEYISTELSSTPSALPSIGSNATILSRGRGALSSREALKEKERQDYEERNFVRLPGESKAERRKARARGEGAGSRDMFGGEDWTGLGGLGDRVVRSVKAGRDGGGDGRKESVLERRGKRRREREDAPDGPREDGRGDLGRIGEAFEKRRKVLHDRAERKMARKNR